MTAQPPPPPGFGPPPPQYPAEGPQYLPPGGALPEFLAVDRRNSIVVDATGVAFEMYGIAVEFTWPEIRSVHYKASDDAKSLMVAVVHVDGRVYEGVVRAKPRERLRAWFTQLAWVLGYYRPTG
ncbi:hypothetical protein [Streptomyces antibioticus]|uniref:hypothetical protein n=1 Tax=Streptomyces antibioticus TaxID=1890 RepID=UPI003D74B790